MPMTDAAIAPIAALIDAIVADPDARARAKLELLKPDAAQALAAVRAQVAEAQSSDRWTSRARPTFLYVMYALLLGAIPMGLIAGVRPATAQAIAQGVAAYLAAIPEPLYALFGTGYLGYTVAREWGKAKAG